MSESTTRYDANGDEMRVGGKYVANNLPASRYIGPHMRQDAAGWFEPSNGSVPFWSRTTYWHPLVPRTITLTGPDGGTGTITEEDERILSAWVNELCPDKYDDECKVKSHVAWRHLAAALRDALGEA